MTDNKKQGKFLDNEIVEQFKHGNEEAFAKIYKVYFNRVLYFAYAHVKNMEIAKDIVQNTFIVAYRAKEKIQHVEAFHAWLMRIAYCECQNSFRKNKIKYVDLSEDIDTDWMEDESNPTISEHLEAVDLQETVAKEIESMHPKLKDVAVLKYLEGLSEQEIAYVLKIPKGTVKSRTYKVRAILQNSLTKKGITPSTYKTYGVTIPALFVAACGYIQANVQMPQPDFIALSDMIKSGVSVGGGILSGISLGFMQKAAIAGVATLSVVGTAVLVNGNHSDAFGIYASDIETVPEAPKEEVAQIKAVEYDSNFTNQPISVNVQVSNDNYDEILLNGTSENTIHENGEYVVQVKKDGKVVAQQVLTITNIDQTPPKYLSYEEIGSTYILHVNDEGSKIDPSVIKYYKDGVLSQDFTYYPETQTIHFNYQAGTMNRFEVYDYAGNGMEVKVE